MAGRARMLAPPELWKTNERHEMKTQKQVELCTLQEAQDLVHASKGRVFSVDFTTRGDGTVRTMRCRTECSKGISGSGAVYDAEEHGLKRVYRMAGDKSERPGHWRSLNLSGIRGLRINGRNLRVSG